MLGLVTKIVVSVLCFIFGWRIWKKEQITLIHSYHYKKVSEDDKKMYTERMGKALIIVGIGILLSGVIDFVTKTSYGWICFGLCFIWGFTNIFKTQKKYNGGVF